MRSIPYLWAISIFMWSHARDFPWGPNSSFPASPNTSFIETAKSDDPARLSVPLPEDDMSRPLEGTSGRASGVASMQLQFRQTTSGAEIRAGSSDADHTGRIDQKAADLTEHFLFGNSLSTIGRDRVRPLCYVIPCGQCGVSGPLNNI
jgi:hypothetical protein